MPRARKHLVCVDDTPYYHVMSRCVRRAFLCGADKVSGRNYEHRRGWIETRLRLLSSLFCIEICAYAVMRNHYHLVVRLNAKESITWTDAEVVERWTSLFRGPVLVQRYCEGAPLGKIESETLADIVRVYRSRLASLSWFMKCLNEPIARQANAEDQCTGHFWEARFQSQALLSEKALFTTMAYVDLNPIRAKMAKTPEQSHYTSVKARIEEPSTASELSTAITELLANSEIRRLPATIRPLAPFSGEHNSAEPTLVRLPMRWPDYLQLVDTTGRIAVQGKRGRIDPSLAPVLERLGMTDKQWLAAASSFREHYRGGEIRLAKTA